MTFVVTGMLNQQVYTPDAVKDMIRSNGGLIANAIPKEQVGESRELEHTDVVPSWLLISDSYQRTYKYIMALVDAIPCLDFNWVVECCNKVSYVQSSSSSFTNRNLFPFAENVSQPKSILIRCWC